MSAEADADDAALPRAIRLPLDSLGLDLKEAVKAGSRRIEEALIREALAQTDSNVTRSARKLGISRRSLQSKMKELGFPQETVFSWAKWVSKGGAEHLAIMETADEEWDFICAAPTVAEMGEWMPGYCSSMKTVDGWEAEDDYLEAPCDGKTEAECRAKLLVMLAEWYREHGAPSAGEPLCKLLGIAARR